MNKQQITVPPENEGERLDKWLALSLEGLTRSAIQHLIEDGQVTIGAKPAAKNYKLRSGDEISISILPPREMEAAAEDIPLDVVYEDDDLLVINKPKGMVVHPAAGNHDGTMVNALLHHCRGSLSGINGTIRPGIVHRIDKDTSGLLIVAKNDLAHVGLAKQIKEHSFTREYEAVVHGNVKLDEGEINAPIGRNPTQRKKMCVTDKNSKSAITHYTVLARYQGFTHVRLRLETGRTHQIRVHMAYIGHPVAGDSVYGPKRAYPNLQGQCLHAKRIGFIHPRSGQYLEFDSPLPVYFTDMLSRLRQE